MKPPRRCTKCNRPGEFYKGYRWCKACVRAYAAEWRRRNSEKVSARGKRQRASHKYKIWRAEYDARPEVREKRSEASRRRRQVRGARGRDAERCRLYHISPEEFSKLAAHGCQICGRKDRLQIDHNHQTGRLRGILCSGCNAGLGLLRDDPKRLTDAAAYIEGKCAVANVIEQTSSSSAAPERSVADSAATAVGKR